MVYHDSSIEATFENSADMLPINLNKQKPSRYWLKSKNMSNTSSDMVTKNYIINKQSFIPDNIILARRSFETLSTIRYISNKNTIQSKTFTRDKKSSCSTASSNSVNNYQICALFIIFIVYEYCYGYAT